MKGRLAGICATVGFVVLWSSGAIAAKIGLQHGSALGLLFVRYIIAVASLALLSRGVRPFIPARGTRARVLLIGGLISGLYSVCYLLAMSRGLSPGSLAIVMGAQPILTAVASERGMTARQALGLALSLSGMVVVLWDGLSSAHVDPLGAMFSVVALLGITLGAIMQKGEKQPPSTVLPLQYTVGLAAVALAGLAAPIELSLDARFLIPGLWLGLIVSVVATTMFYELISERDLVNVTSLLYLVPATTMLLDWLVLGSPLLPTTLLGLGATVLGLLLAFPANSTPKGAPTKG